MTWVTVCASLLMAAATVCAFIFAVQKDYFRDIEDAKYQVFWSDLEEAEKEQADGSSKARPRT